jgi:hypothetical protein
VRRRLVRIVCSSVGISPVDEHLNEAEDNCNDIESNGDGERNLRGCKTEDVDEELREL